MIFTLRPAISLSIHIPRATDVMNFLRIQTESIVLLRRRSTI